MSNPEPCLCGADDCARCNTGITTVTVECTSCEILVPEEDTYRDDDYDFCSERCAEYYQAAVRLP